MTQAWGAKFCRRSTTTPEQSCPRFVNEPGSNGLDSCRRSALELFYDGWLMWISELFHSVQGEGLYLGTPSTFIRTSGCNLRCWFCDTRYSSWEPEGREWSIEQLMHEVSQGGNEHVVITGGEPLLLPELVPLSAALAELGKFITIETAGTVYQPVTAHLMSISPKRANSTPHGTPWAERHEQRRHRPAVLSQLLSNFPYQLKFVIDQPADIDDVQQFLGEIPEIDPSRVFLMAQGVEVQELKQREAWMQEEANSRGWRITRRLHVELFGNTRGT